MNTITLSQYLLWRDECFLGSIAELFVAWLWPRMVPAFGTSAPGTLGTERSAVISIMGEETPAVYSPEAGN